MITPQLLHTKNGWQVVPHRVWKNLRTGATASIAGACPWFHASEKSEWRLEDAGLFVLRNPHTNETGMGHRPMGVIDCILLANRMGAPSRHRIGD